MMENKCHEMKLHEDVLSRQMKRLHAYNVLCMSTGGNNQSVFLKSNLSLQ